MYGIFPNGERSYLVQSASESQSWQENKTSVSNEFLSTTIINVD